MKDQLTAQVTLTADIAVVRLCNKYPEILLIERGRPPFAGQFALPGGKMNADESIEEAAARELFEETGLQRSDLQSELQYLKVLSDPDRDPRGRFVSVVFLAIADRHDVVPHAGDDAKELNWCSLSIARQLSLAFDHNVILDFLSFDVLSF